MGGIRGEVRKVASGVLCPQVREGLPGWIDATAPSGPQSLITRATIAHHSLSLSHRQSTLRGLTEVQRLQLLKPGVIMSSVLVALLIKSTMVPTLWSGLK